MRSRCPVCRGYYDDADRTGRPSRYCSITCRNQRNHDLDRAMRELAQGHSPKPADAADALQRAEIVASVWLSHDNRGPSGLRAELIDTHWLGERPPTRLAPAPDPRAVTALIQRIGELRQLVAQHEAEQRRLRDAERAKDAARRDRQTRRQARAADAEWRQQLLTGGTT